MLPLHDKQHNRGQRPVLIGIGSINPMSSTDPGSAVKATASHTAGNGSLLFKLTLHVNTFDTLTA